MLSVVIVNFNGGYRLKQAIDGCLAKPVRGGLEIIVVENESTDDSTEFLKLPEYAGVRVIRPGVNVGYTAGNNIGHDAAKGDIVLLMTPDRYPLDDALDRMVERFEEDESLGAIGGFCLKPDMSVDHHFLGLPTVWQSYLFAFWRTRGAMRLKSFRRYMGADLDLEQPLEVPQPAGGCYAFRRGLVESPIQHPDFGLFYSDVDTARRVHDTGKRTVVFPDIRFVHDHEEKPANPVWGPLLTLDYYVGILLYHRLHNGRLAYLWGKTLFTLHLSAWLARDTLALFLGRQSREQHKRHVDLFLNFLKDRNVVVENAKRQLAQRDAAAPTG